MEKLKNFLKDSKFNAKVWRSAQSAFLVGQRGAEPHLGASLPL